MATLPPAPRGLKIAVSGTFQSAKWANVLHAQFASGTPTGNDLQTLATQIGANYATNMLFQTSSLCHITQTVVQDISSNLGNAGLDTTDRVGNGVGAQMPANAAMVVSWRIQRRYRGSHPRTYLPAIISSIQNDSRTWSQTAAQTAQAHALTFLGYVNTLSTPSTGSIVLGSFSYWYTPVKGQPPQLRPTPLWDPFLAPRVDQRIDTQRRRLGKSVG